MRLIQIIIMEKLNQITLLQILARVYQAICLILCRNFKGFQFISLTILKTLITPSPPPHANWSPPFEKSTVKQALLRPLI